MSGIYNKYEIHKIMYRRGIPHNVINGVAEDKTDDKQDALDKVRKLESQYPNVQYIIFEFDDHRAGDNSRVIYITK